MVEGAFYLAILLLMLGIWSSLRWPFTRKNTLLKSKGEEALTQKALSRLVWPSTIAAQQATEIRIAPGLYYSFLTFIYWVTFIVVETLLSEILDDKLGSAGYFGCNHNCGLYRSGFLSDSQTRKWLRGLRVVNWE
jgi:hypothetical protein